jgi:TonB-dependent SusC/RagA subfamily outer membrane receptor
MFETGEVRVRGSTGRHSTSPASLVSLAWRCALAATIALAAFAVRPLGAQAASTGIVRGTVVEASTLRPVPDVQVTVVGSRIGGVTNANGEFTVSGVTAGTQTVRAQQIGFRAAEQQVTVTAGGTVRAEFRLQRVTVQLNSVVVTGTAGATQQRAIGNSMATISASDVSALAPTPQVANLIAGRSPGVVVVPGTGMVGSGPRIRIRGASSFSLTDQPLLYVDGVRVDNDVASGPRAQGTSSVISRLNDINPDDIESIEILKGPAAATLYGTEASNGVIQIITKKGRADKTQMNITGQAGTNWLMDPERVIPISYARDSTGQLVTFDPVRSEAQRGTPLFGLGQNQQLNLSLNGGSGTMRYYGSGGYDHQTGIESNNNETKYTTRVNVGLYPNAKFNANLSMGYVQSTTNVPSEGSSGRGLIVNAVFANPLTQNTPTRGFLSAPPEILHSPAFTSAQGLRRLTQSLQMNNDLTSWFSQRLNLGLDVTNELDQSITRRDQSLAPYFSASTVLGSKSSSQRTVYYSTVDYSATAKAELPKEFSSASSVGAQYYRRRDEFLSATGREFPASGLDAISATAITTGGDDYQVNTTVGVYAQEQFGWRNQAFVTGAVRVDNNSAFGENFDFVAYPKLAGTWVISEAPFWKVKQISTLRLRAAYGQSGQQPRAFAALRTYTPVTGGDGTSAVTPAFVGNPDLAPERSGELETGFDAGLFDERIGVEMTYYRRKTNDAILERATAPSFGFPGTAFVNAGSIQTTGAELKLNAVAWKSNRVNWDWTFNLSKNQNKVLSLGGEQFFNVVEDGTGFITPLGSQRHEVGFPLGAWFGKKVVSATVDNTGKATNLMCATESSSSVACDQAPVLFLGRSAPDLEGSLSSTLTLFGSVRLYALVDFKQGALTFNNTEGYRCQVRLICRENVMPTESDPVRVAVAQSNRVFWNSYLQNSNFGKLREVSASYTLPSKIAARVGASGGTVTVSARNLHTWTSYPGMDPEAAFLSQQFTRTEQANTPPLAQFLTTLRLTF